MVSESREQLLDVAKSLLAGKEDFLKGVRKINSLRHGLDDTEHDVFLIFRGIDSETDHIPDLSRRTLFDEEFLKKVDLEVQEIFFESKNKVLEACEKIVEIYK